MALLAYAGQSTIAQFGKLGVAKAAPPLLAGPPPDAEPPGMRTLNIPPMSPADHEVFIRQRATDLVKSPPRDVPPLPGQRFEPFNTAPRKPTP